MTDSLASEAGSPTNKKVRKSGTPTGHAGEYFVMGELLRQGFDAQLADRNTKGYDVLVGQPEDEALRKVQVKTVRAAPWYVSVSDFEKNSAELNQVTIYVLIGSERAKTPIRYFIARNCDLANHVHRPNAWQQTASRSGFMPLKAVEQHESKWDVLRGGNPN